MIGRGLGNPSKRGSANDFYNGVVLNYEGDQCLIWPFAIGKNSYAQIKINGKKRDVHRLVCEEEYGPPPSSKHEAAHSCTNGRSGCVAKRHLRWATSKENGDDMVSHGNSTRGEKHPNGKLSKDDVLAIRQLADSTTHAALALRFGISRANVSMIVSRRTWAWLD